MLLPHSRSETFVKRLVHYYCNVRAFLARGRERSCRVAASIFSLSVAPLRLDQVVEDQLTVQERIGLTWKYLHYCIESIFHDLSDALRR